MPANDDLLFKVVTKEGHEYRIFATGAIEGFPDDRYIVNYFPALKAQAENRVALQVERVFIGSTV